MKLASFVHQGKERIGAAVGDTALLDLQSHWPADQAVPVSMVDLIERGEQGLQHAAGVLATRPPIVNLQCDVDHPTQSMADLQHLVTEFGSLEALRELAEKLGHEFRDLDLLGRALVHSSMGNEGKPSYERLEFLGDAVLGLVASRWLYDRSPHQPERSHPLRPRPGRYRGLPARLLACRHRGAILGANF